MTGTPCYVQLDQRCAAIELFLSASPYLYGRLLLDTQRIPLSKQCQPEGVVHRSTCRECKPKTMMPIKCHHIPLSS